jgi:hypothetical protein
MATPDPQLDGIRRTFDSAFQRVCAATTPTDAENEFSSMLDWLYRLNELGKRRLGDKTFHQRMVGSDDLRAARAAIWARTFDVHRVVAVAAMGDVFSDYFTAMFGVLVWKPLASLPEQSTSTTATWTTPASWRTGRCSAPAAGPSMLWRPSCSSGPRPPRASASRPARSLIPPRYPRSPAQDPTNPALAPDPAASGKRAGPGPGPCQSICFFCEESHLQGVACGDRGPSA